MEAPNCDICEKVTASQWCDSCGVLICATETCLAQHTGPSHALGAIANEDSDLGREGEIEQQVAVEQLQGILDGNTKSVKPQ